MSSARVAPGLWIDPAEDPRETGTQPVGEKDTLWDYLRRYRLTLELKCGDLDAEQLARRSVPPSTLSLLGLVRHLARVEHSWFRRILQGHPELPKLYRTAEDPDLDFTGAVADPAVVEEAWARWRAEVESADAWLAGWDDLDATVDCDGQPVAVRDILVHLVEEYARHVGHADLLRECIDGRTGQ
ncbi:DinB family protein [Nocardioides pantholopis]|uniref:DinB family protein n=1 Tax=Nocardioides pantholopis TaxID=2483798 RepID=UPI000F0791D0|nr:DinB family protein [Nocardioides pantholopis]